MDLSFRCANLGCLAGLIIIVLAVIGLSLPFFLGALAAREIGLP